MDDLLHHLVISPLACIQSTHRINLSVKFPQLEPNYQQINSKEKSKYSGTTDASDTETGRRLRFAGR